jgi:hypothetical protein
MQTKLTLRLDAELIRRAKTVAQRSGKSVSQLVAEYFAMLETGQEPASGPDDALPPNVRALKGMLRGADVDIEDYRAHLEARSR